MQFLQNTCVVVRNCEIDITPNMRQAGAGNVICVASIDGRICLFPGVTDKVGIDIVRIVWIHFYENWDQPVGF